MAFADVHSRVSKRYNQRNFDSLLDHEKLLVKYTGQKISKICWKPTSTTGYDAQGNIFACGSWDESYNTIGMWNYEKERVFHESMQESVSSDPQLLTTIRHDGGVTDMKFIDDDKLIAASSNGSVELIQYSRIKQELEIQFKWSNIHRFASQSCPCTALAVNMPNIVTVGEDSRINVLKIDTQTPVAVMDDRGSNCSINGVASEGMSEIVTVDSIGRLKVWDMRQSGSNPAKIMILSGEQLCLQCVDQHPNQQHVVVTGGQDGSIIIWDLRQERYPAVILKAHLSTVWEAKFHRLYPNNLFTCSEDGAVWHWDGSSIATVHLPTSIRHVSEINTDTNQNPWLVGDIIRNKMKISSLAPHNKLPINTFDIVNQDLICGTDGEAIIIVQKLLLT